MKPSFSHPPGDENSSSEGTRERDDGSTAWWPPAPEPSSETAGEGSQSPSKPGSEPKQTPTTPDPRESETSEPEREGDNGNNSEPPDDDFHQPPPPEIPNWQERIYHSRHGEAPEKFMNRPHYSSCGDFVSLTGVELISPSLAECLDAGSSGTGVESAIAVLTETDAVHVWFVRVGPEGSEYFIDATESDGSWKHARCDSSTTIGTLACDEPAIITDEPRDSDDTEVSEEPTDPSPSPTSEEPEAPEEASTSDPNTADDES